MIGRLIADSARYIMLVMIATVFALAAGLYAIFHLPLDAIPDLSDTQVIVYTEYPGQAPQVVEDQVTYPLTTAMLTVPKSRVVRGFSYFGVSFVYVIFEDGTDIYWARSRVLEYLNAAARRLPNGVTPTLGPDATCVGGVDQHRLCAKDRSLRDLRSLQAWYVRYGLSKAEGVAEVASVGGFRDAFGLRQAVAHIPVLQGTKLRERAVLGEERILVDPTDTGGVRSKRGRDAVRQAARGGVEILKDARARPVDIGAVFEDHIDERHAEIREPAHHARLRHREHGGGQRIGDLVLDHLRGLARIFGVDDDLRVGEVRDGIEGKVENGIKTRRHGEYRGDHHQHDVARRGGDQASDHWGAPASARPLSAALRLLSASMRKLAVVTTASPSATPSRIST